VAARTLTSCDCTEHQRDGFDLLHRAHGRDRLRLETAAQAAFDEFTRLEGLLSPFRPESECSLVNRRAAHRPVRVSPEVFRLLSLCFEHSRETDGAFDITVGPLKRAWGFFGGTGSVPSADALAAARRHVGHHLVRLDAGTQTVQFDHSGVEIDLGGVAVRRRSGGGGSSDNAV
jgi:thiamine biosynthesis lipoprotein